MARIGYPRVLFNISGTDFETFPATLKRFPDTLLGNKDRRNKYYCVSTKSYFFDRNRVCFEAILFYYQSNGILRCPPCIKLDVFVSECRFYELSEETINHMKTKEGILPSLQKRLQPVMLQSATCRQRLWIILEHPEVSNKAWFFTAFSLTMIFFSIINACLDTLGYIEVNTAGTRRGRSPWMITEMALNTWFFIELATRFMCSPSRVRFVKSYLNWIDAFAIIPYLPSYFIRERVTSLLFLRCFRFMRIIRLIRLSKIAKLSKRVRIVVAIIRASSRDFQYLLCCFLVTIVIGGALMYYAEQSSSKVTQFTSIPLSFWWATQTVCTVGYGDMFPITTVGKLVATTFMLLGALTTSLSVLSMGVKFQAIYEKTLNIR